MNRKTFLSISSALMAAPLLSPVKSWASVENLKNWAGNFTFSTDKVFYPKTVSEVKKLVKEHKHFRALGTRHCFNRIADSKDNLVAVTEMNDVIAIDKTAMTVTVGSGIKYGVLSPYLDDKGYALHNLASLPHISVAGSIATATHGSGVANGNLSSQVRGLDIVTPDGEEVSLSKEKDGEKFLGAVVGLGALGIVTSVTLAIQPTFDVRQNVFLKLPLSQLKEHFYKIVSAGYSVSLFTDWQSESINEVWIKSRVESGTDFNNMHEFYGGKAATKDMHPIADISAENCTEQMGVAGPWYKRLPHFKMGFTPSSGKELQSEFFIPKKNAVEAILAIQKMGKQIGPHLLITEIRTIAADDLWLSPCRHQDSVAIHFTWKQETEAVMQLLPLIEKELAPFNYRPHWGKLFTISSKDLVGRYEKMEDFKKLMKTYDPQGKLRNDFINKNLFGI